MALIAGTSIIIMYACDSFEEAADHLGRNMKAGIKGATINAIGSSLPELFTTLFLLFGPIYAPHVFGAKEDGFSAGIATCAGSAVFNAVIIPALCVLAVMFWGVKKSNGTRERVTSIQLDKRIITKDGFFFILSEVALIYFLGGTTMVWWMGLALAGLYVVYITVTLKGGFVDEDEDEDEDDGAEDDDGDGDEDDDDEDGIGLFGLGWALDFRTRIYGDKEFEDDTDNGRAWIVLSCAVAAIGVACAGIAWAVELSAHALGIEPYFTAVILAAAATSVPDTVLSVKDAVKGEYDDAVANAVGSNIFDITICLGIPLLLYGLIVGDVSLTASGASADVQVLRWVLLAVTACVLSIFLIGPNVGKGKAVALFSLYFLWTAFIVGRASDAAWTQPIIDNLPGQTVSNEILSNQDGQALVQFINVEEQAGYPE
jgi:cation:H+ antiporter